MLLCKFQLGELPEGDKNSIMEQLDSAERIAMEERLETSYRQIREYQDTLTQAEGRAEAESPEVSRSQLWDTNDYVVWVSRAGLKLCSGCAKYYANMPGPASPSKNASKFEQCTMCREVCACVHDLKWSKHETESNADMRAFN